MINGRPLISKLCEGTIAHRVASPEQTRRQRKCRRAGERVAEIFWPQSDRMSLSLSSYTGRQLYGMLMNAPEEASELRYVRLLARKFSSAKILRDAIHLRILSPIQREIKVAAWSLPIKFSARLSRDSIDGIKNPRCETAGAENRNIKKASPQNDICKKLFIKIKIIMKKKILIPTP